MTEMTKRTKRWLVPLAKVTELTRGERHLYELDRRLGKRATKGYSPTDARFSEQLRCLDARLKPEASVEDAGVFIALELSFLLQAIAARLMDDPNSPDATADRERVEAMWKVAKRLDTVGKASQDARVVLLRLVEAARETDLEVDSQVRVVVRRMGAIDATFARKIDETLLRRLLLAWNPKRGRPRMADGKQDDPFSIGADLIYRAINVKIAPASLRKLWERGRAGLRTRI